MSVVNPRNVVSVLRYICGVIAICLATSVVSFAASPLLDAVEQGNRAAVLALLAKGADPNVAGADGTTPIMWAASNGDVEIARALINEPEMLLADEPTGNLDSRTSVEIMAIFQQLNEHGITIIMVTHEQDIAAYAKRNVVMRDGLIREDQLVTQRSDAKAQLQNGRDAAEPIGVHSLRASRSRRVLFSVSRCLCGCPPRPPRSARHSSTPRRTATPKRSARCCSRKAWSSS